MGTDPGPQLPSASRLRAIGSRLRRSARGEDVDPAKLREDDELLDAFRRAHAAPMNSLAMSMRSMCRTLGVRADVTQRLKRKQTIREKLARRVDAHDLSRMRDLGGVRVVFDSLADLRQLQERAEEHFGSDLVTMKDYITEPRASGYRAVHLEVVRHGLAIEIQLRTPAMHAWAENVEMMSGVFGTNYKQDGAHTFQEFMRLVAVVDQLQEAGRTIPEELRLRAELLSDELAASLDTHTYPDEEPQP